MELTRSVVTEKAEEYQKEEPLYAVEAEQIERLPKAFPEGKFSWRDAEWIVRWYYRRFLGEFPDDERRQIEARFGDNDFGTVEQVIEDAIAADSIDRKLDALTDLAAVSVPVGSAFLFFIDPEEYIVIGEREWGVLYDADEIDTSYPNLPSVSDYGTYLETCRALGADFDCDMWTLYRGLWRLAKQDSEHR